MPGRVQQETAEGARKAALEDIDAKAEGNIKRKLRIAELFAGCLRGCGYQYPTRSRTSIGSSAAPRGSGDRLLPYISRPALHQPSCLRKSGIGRVTGNQVPDAGSTQPNCQECVRPTSVPHREPDNGHESPTERPDRQHARQRLHSQATIPEGESRLLPETANNSSAKPSKYGEANSARQLTNRICDNGLLGGQALCERLAPRLWANGGLEDFNTTILSDNTALVNERLPIHRGSLASVVIRVEKRRRTSVEGPSRKPSSVKLRRR